MEAGNDNSGHPVEKPSPGDVIAAEPPRGSQQDLPERAAASFAELVCRAPYGVTHHLRGHVIERANVEVEQRSLYLSDFSIDIDFGVNPAILIASVPAMEKTSYPVTMESSVPGFAIEDEIPAANLPGPVFRMLEDGENLVPGSSCDAFIRIEDEDPVVREAVECEVALSASPEIFALFQPDVWKSLPDQLRRSIGGEGVDDENLIGPGKGSEAVADLIDLVVREHESGYFEPLRASS